VLLLAAPAGSQHVDTIVDAEIAASLGDEEVVTEVACDVALPARTTCVPVLDENLPGSPALARVFRPPRQFVD
jgi:hypothetical protein